MLTSLLPSPPPADGAGGAGDRDVTPPPAAAAAAGEAPAAASPAAAAVAAARGWQRRGQWQGRRRQEYQGMNKRVCACNDLKQKPLFKLVQSMQRFLKRTKISPPCPPARQSLVPQVYTSPPPRPAPRGRAARLSVHGQLQTVY